MNHSGMFKKGHDPRRHNLGSNPGQAKTRTLIKAFKKDSSAIAKTVNHVLIERQFPDGEAITPSVWVKLLEVYLDRVLGKPIDPNKSISVQPVLEPKSTSEMITALGGREHLEKLVNGQ